MKICVINLSGNVGKSTLAVHLLAAYTPGARILSVESINAGATQQVQGLDVEELGASRFKEILRELMQGEDVIVDVGASNVMAFMAEMKLQKRCRRIRLGAGAHCAGSQAAARHHRND